MLKEIIFIFCDELKVFQIKSNYVYNTWYQNQKYLYFIDIKDYYNSEQNVIEFLGDYKYIWQNSRIYLSMTNKTEDEIRNGTVIPKNLDTKKNSSIKKRLCSGQFVYGNTFKKVSKSDSYYLILIEPYFKTKTTNIQISLSKRINNYIITKDNFTVNNTITQTLEVKNTYENFYKFTFEDFSVENQNIILFIKEFNIASYYDERFNIGQFKGNRLYLIQKGSTISKTHLVYIGLIGEILEVTLEITILKNDIIFLDSEQRDFLPFYIENIKYDDDKYIIENYSRLNTKDIKEYELNIIPFYGDYTLTYYNSYNTTDLYNLYNYTNGTIIDKKINIISGTSNFFRLSCTTPCALKFGYIYNKNEDKLQEGDVRINYFDPSIIYSLAINNVNKKYYLFFQLYGDEENFNEEKNYVKFIYTDIEYDLILLFKNYSKNYRIKYYNYLRPLSGAKLTYQIKMNTLVKFYFVSTSLYNNIIEGLNIIEYPKTNLAFKIQRDIKFDYISIDIYSHNEKRDVSVLYDIQLITPSEISPNGNVLCELPVSGKRDKNISLIYSNPYNKYNTFIDLDTIVVVTFQIKSTQNAFPIFFNIKYFYNNSAINIPYQETKILKTNENYKIFGNNEYVEKNNIILNINKCNINKNYTIFGYYENVKNIIWKNDIINKRNIIINNNIFNNTNIKLEELNELDPDGNIINNENNNNTNNFTDDEIYMNYFIIGDLYLDFQKITKNYKIKYTNNNEKVNLKWSPYISKNFGIPELTIQYNLYIFPENSKINSICQLSLLPPNYTIINETEYDININKGNYKINIIASVVNKELPLFTFYDELEIKVSYGFSIIIFICLSISFIFLITFMILYSKYINSGKKNKTSHKKSFWISLVEQRQKIKEKKIKKSLNKFNINDDSYLFDEEE